MALRRATDKARVVHFLSPQLHAQRTLCDWMGAHVAFFELDVFGNIVWSWHSSRSPNCIECVVEASRLEDTRW